MIYPSERPQPGLPLQFLLLPCLGPALRRLCNSEAEDPIRQAGDILNETI